jgi:hypothetical protein
MQKHLKHVFIVLFCFTQLQYVNAANNALQFQDASSKQMQKSQEKSANSKSIFSKVVWSVCGVFAALSVVFLTLDLVDNNDCEELRNTLVDKTNTLVELRLNTKSIYKDDNLLKMENESLSDNILSINAANQNAHNAIAPVEAFKNKIILNWSNIQKDFTTCDLVKNFVHDLTLDTQYSDFQNQCPLREIEILYSNGDLANFYSQLNLLSQNGISNPKADECQIYSLEAKNMMLDKFYRYMSMSVDNYNTQGDFREICFDERVLNKRETSDRSVTKIDGSFCTNCTLDTLENLRFECKLLSN